MASREEGVAPVQAAVTTCYQERAARFTRTPKTKQHAGRADTENTTRTDMNSLT